MFECYDNIIGFSSFECECQADNRPEDYNVSHSGLYLDELTSIGKLVSGECDRNMWAALISAYKAGIKRLVSDSNALLLKNYALKRQPAKDQIIGQIKARDTYNPNKNYALVRLACNPIRSGYFTLNGLGTLFEASGAVTVGLYNNIDGHLEDFELTTTANKLHKNPLTDKNYPLHSKYADCLQYFLVYEFDENNRPKDNKVNCGCGTALNFNLNKPYFLNGYRAAPWTNFVMASGGEINSLTELEDLEITGKNNLMGLIIDAHFHCKVNETVCKDSLDFVGNPLALSLAHAAQYIIGIEVAKAALRNPELDPQALINRDIWEENMAEWQDNYNEHINYIVSEISLTGTDCLTCKDILKITRRGLFA